jgi:hypothetical protein
MPRPPETRNGAKNAFARKFLRRLAQCDDEPETAAEAFAAVAWKREPHPHGYALLHPAQAADEPPFATFFDLSHALLAQAALPALGRSTLWRLGTENEAQGHPLFVEGRLAGYLRPFDPNLAQYLTALDVLTRDPRALACLLEASSGVALEHAGRYLERALRARESGGEE